MFTLIGPNPRRVGLLSLLAVTLFVPLRVSQAQPPHADVPLDPLEFSIDALSPSLVDNGLSDADVLIKPGPSPLVVAIGMGLTPLDLLDGLSVNEGELLPDDEFVILFSVSRSSVGLSPPDADLVAANRPFNVQQQAALGQAPGDVFMTTRPFNLGGLIPAPGRGLTNNNTLVVNQGDTGGVDMDLKNAKAPIKDDNAALTKDAIDALAKASSSSAGARGGGTPGDPTQAGPLFFSLRRGSPSLQQLPGPPSPANIYFDPEPHQPGTEQLFLPADALGLTQNPFGDDISGFTVFRNGLGRGVPVPIVLFALAPGSPSLGSAFSPADIFISTGAGTFTRFATAAQLGLATTDSISGFTILRTTDVNQLIMDSAIQLRIPGDHDQNGMLTSSDCAQFLACYSGEGERFDQGGAASHTVAVGPGSIFNPATLTVETGDLVTWAWADGPHTVVSGEPGFPDGAFNSGAPAGAGHLFTVTFNAALLNAHPQTSYPYYSEPDLATGLAGEIFVVPHACATYDMDFDGDVDCADWREFRDLYSQLNDGKYCVPLTIEEFVAVVLCISTDPLKMCIADLNDDGLNNGLDIHPFIQALIAGS